VFPTQPFPTRPPRSCRRASRRRCERSDARDQTAGGSSS
jgi:hypothetical protein